MSYVPSLTVANVHALEGASYEEVPRVGDRAVVIVAAADTVAIARPCRGPAKLAVMPLQ